MLPLIIISLFNICMLVSCCDDDTPTGTKLHTRFFQTYSNFLHYSEWDVLQILKSATLKEICIKHASIQRHGIRGEAIKFKKHIRKHINYSWGGTLNIVRIDLLQCTVIFINDERTNGRKSTFYLAEGSKAHSTFKLILNKRNFYVVGEIYSNQWFSWFSKENIQLSSTEELDEDVSEEEELQGNEGNLKNAELQGEGDMSEMKLIRNIRRKGIELEADYVKRMEKIFPGEEAKEKEIPIEEDLKVEEMQQEEDLKVEEILQEENIKVDEMLQEEEMKIEEIQHKEDLKKDEKVHIEGLIKEEPIQQENKIIEKEV